MNPVVFEPQDKTPDLVVLRTSLSEMFGWNNRIVGYNSRGIFIVNKRIAQKGYYDFPAEFLAWPSLTSIAVKRRISKRGLIISIFMILFGCLVFDVGWIQKTYTGPGTVVIPLIFIPGGVAGVLGMRRVILRVSDGSQTYEWVSEPFDKLAKAVWEELEPISAKAREAR